MYNLFYRDSHLGHRMSGPKKVIENLIRTFEDFDVPFALNAEKYDRTIFLHWDEYQYSKYQRLKKKNNLAVGPQAWPFDSVFEKLTEYKTILVPSWWVDYKLRRYFNRNEVTIWPVGIYPPSISGNPEIDVLIYYKNRPIEDYQYMANLLQKKGCSGIVLQYGNYTQDDFRNALSSVKSCVIIDNTESQGIAIQEMMACGKPLFVWDQTIWDHMGPEYSVCASSVPYWSCECGELVSKKELLESSFDTFISHLNDYDPISFYEKTLTPQKSLEILNGIYEN
jgi:hypothetical protein